MPKKVRELIKLIQADGWYLANQVGSHKQFKHPTKSGKVTISGHRDNDDVPINTERSVLQQAGLLKKNRR